MTDEPIQRDNAVRSLILGRDIVLDTPHGREERSFLGSGKVGAGGTVEGIWDYLIGPNYSSPNFITWEGFHREQEEGGQNKSRLIKFSMQRIRGSGILFGKAAVGDLSVELIEWVPWDGIDAVRLLGFTNTGNATLKAVKIYADVDVFGHPVLGPDRLTILQPQGGFCYGRECVNWADRRADISWNLPSSVMHTGDCRYRLSLKPFDLTPGGTYSAALVHRVQEAQNASPLPAVDWAKQLQSELEAWGKWFAQGNDSVKDPVWGSIVEAQLAFMRMQQCYEGGLIAGVRKYAHSYIRDMHGAARGFLAAGHLQEVLRELEWIDRKFKAFKVIVNASEMGLDRRDFGVHGNNKGTELEAYYLLMTRGFLQRGGNPAEIERFKESLLAAAAIQMENSRNLGWRFKYNGDETERYVPVKDGDAYGFGKVDWQKRAEWSMPSHVLAMASTDFVATVLAPRWGLDPAPYREAIEQWRKSFAATFMPDGRTVPAWTVFTDGSLPSYPVPQYLCFADWVDAPFPAEQKRAWTQEAFTHLNSKGILPVSPGQVEGSTGHALGILLFALKASGAGKAQIDRVENAILNAGQLQWYGLVNEFYGPGNTPNPHNLRPFETGPVLDAVVRK